MTEAETFSARTSEIEQTRTHEQTPDSEDKHSASTDSPAETTGGEFDASSVSFRHEEDDDMIRDNEHSTHCSPSTENDENRFMTLVHQKDDEIKRLISENKSIRSILSEKEIREKELVEELERHAELVERQQNQLDEAECQIHQRQQQISAIRQQLHRTQQQLNSIVLQQHQPKASPAKLKAHNEDSAASNAFLEQLCSAAGNNSNPDEVCAALSTFIERNRSSNAPVSDGDDITPELIEYLNKLISDNAAAVPNQTNGEEANTLISMLLEQYPCENDGNGMKDSGIKSSKTAGKSHLTTVRDAIGAGNGRLPNGTAAEQPFYRGSAASSATATATANLVSSRGKFSQHIGSPSIVSPHSATIIPHSQSARSSTSQLNGSGLHQKSSFSSNALQTGVTPSSSSSNAKPLSEEEQRIVAEMQERIAENVTRLGSRPLNTFVIAHQCKRLMLAYNIGQRLFAKAVMCQVVKSQGSLSELLSKPRAWHKLTDKGREAFRRIYGWLSDNGAIDLLCQLSPRRVAMPGDRIEHPSAESLLDHGDSAVYEAEFQANRAAALANSGFDESLNGLITSNQYPDEDDDLKSPASHMIKLSTPGTSAGGSPPRTLNHSAPTTVNVASPAASLSSCASSIKGVANGCAASGSMSTGAITNSRWRHDDIPREKIIGIFEAEKAKLRDQVKQCVDDSLTQNGGISDDSTPNSPRNSNLPNASRIFRGDLAPITPAQFDKYQILDTEEVVKEVKDYLSHHSISQRQFGEAVLGLSQGSVSDLLARPKSWAMLTHKGREPFIRMRIFLDEHAGDERPPASLNIQCEKTEGLNFGMEEECRDTPEPDNAHRNIQIKNENSEENNTSQQYFESAISSVLESSSSKPDEATPLDTFDLCRRVKEYLSQNSISQRAFGEHILGMTSGTVSDLLSRPKSWKLLTPKGRDAYTRMLRFVNDEHAMEALRNNVLTRTSNNVVSSNANDTSAMRDPMVPSKPFASVIDNGVDIKSLPPSVRPSAATFSASATAEYITSPLPAAAFTRMPDDDDEHKQLSQFLMEQNTENGYSLKRKASLSADSGSENFSSSSAKKLPRFQRTVITDEQKEALFFIFSHEQRPSAKMIDQLAARLNLSSRTVTNWFHNHRTRQKAKETKLASEAAANGLPPPPTKPNPLQVLDPTTREWYTDLTMMLAQNAGSNNNNNVISNQNNGFLIGDYTPFLDGALNDIDDIMVNSDMIRLDSSMAHDNYASDSSNYESIKNNNYGGGVELEEEEDSAATDHRVSSSKHGSLNKLIARMHDRLGAEAHLNEAET